MKVKEATAKRLLAEGGIAVPRSVVCDAAERAGSAFTELGRPVAVVKAHVAAGGRGKAGLVREVSSAAEAERAAADMLGRTHEGQVVREVLLEEAVDHDEEVYVGVTVDSRAGRPALVVVAEGGVEVESLAHDQDRLRVAHFAPGQWMSIAEAEGVARRAGLDGSRAAAAASVGSTLTRLFSELEARTIEINPLTFAADGTPIALDAKLDLDEDADFRRSLEISADYADDYERRAAGLGLTFVPLTGDVALFGMGAGLTLTALDLVAESGGRAANFSELRGGLGPEQVKANFELILDFADATPSVTSILLVASLVGTPIRAFVTGVADALKERRGARPLRVASAVHATGAALYTMSLAEAREAMRDVGVAWYDDVREAARYAAGSRATAEV